MPTQTLVPIDDRDSWNDALAGTVHAHGHTWNHAAAFGATGDHPCFLYVDRDDEGRTITACPIAVRGQPGDRDVYSPYGFSGFVRGHAAEGIAERWHDFAVDNGWVASYLLQHPVLDPPDGLPGDVPYVTGQGFVLDILPPPEAIIDGMSRRRRAELRGWEREPAPLITARDELGAFFAARQASGVYRFPAETWGALAAAPSVLSIGAVRDGRVVAAAMFGVAGDTADYLFGISLPGAENLSAPLIWEAVKLLRGEAVTRLHLGGGIRSGDGVAEFKRRFGATAAPIMSLRWVHRPEPYKALCARARQSEDRDQDYFPPYRKVLR